MNPRALGIRTLVRKLLSSALMNARERAMLMLLANGMSPKEVCRLRLENLRLSKGFVRVSGRTRIRIVPLLPWTTAAVDDWLVTRHHSLNGWLFPSPAGKPLRTRRLREIVARVVRRVFYKGRSPGVELQLIRRLSPGNLSLYFAAEAINRGMPGRELVEITGYKHLETIWTRSAPPSTETLVKAVAQIAREPWFRPRGLRAKAPLAKKPVQRTRRTRKKTMSTIVAVPNGASPGLREPSPAAPIAIGYVRRSKESTERTVSLETQTAQIEEYIKAHGWRLAEMLCDDGVSGGRRKRLVRLEDAVQQHRAQIVVCYHLDRYARDAAALLDSLRDYTRRGVELYVVGRGRVETETASGYLSTAIEGVVAEHYRKVISEKVKHAHARLRMQGRRASRQPPYGYRFEPDGTDSTGRQKFLIVPDPDEQALLVEIARLAATGLSLRGISKALADIGVLARNGRPFAPFTLSRMAPRLPKLQKQEEGATQ